MAARQPGRAAAASTGGQGAARTRERSPCLAHNSCVKSAKGREMENLIGTQINNYTLTRKLGQGGMGVVYLAEHAFIQRWKAVKVLSPEAARSPMLLRRFYDEAT